MIEGELKVAMFRPLYFTITSDARRRASKMTLKDLAIEYVWQEREQQRGTTSVKERAKRIQGLIESEVMKRNAAQEFEKLINERKKNTKL